MDSFPCVNDFPRTPFFRPVQQALAVILLSVLVLAGVFALYSVRWIILTTLIGIGLGVLIIPVMTQLKDRFRFPHALSAFVVLVVLLGSVTAIGWGVFQIISEQLLPFIQRLPEVLSSAQQEILKLFRKYPWIAEQVQEFGAADALQNTLNTFLSGVKTGMTALAGFLFVVAVALYLAVSPRNYARGFLSLFPAHMRGRAEQIMHASAVTLRRWFYAQLIAMAGVGAATAAALWVIGIDYWLLFGVLTAALDIVPYIGPLIAAASVLVTTLGTQPDKTLWVLIAFLGVQQLESNLLIPLVMKGRIKLPPIQLMTLMLVMGSWFGIIGVFAAPPLFAVARTIYLIAYVPMMNRRIEPPKKQAA